MATKKVSPKETNVIKGFKGFDENLKCRDKQYELNSNHSEPDAIVCEKGLHFCENPLDVLDYYPAAGSRFAEVEGTGKLSKEECENKDTKVSCTHLKIGGEITLTNLIQAGIKFIFERTTLTEDCTNTEKNKQASNSGDRGAASNSGYSGAASNSGYRGAASNSGDSGAASNSGYRGAASNSGYRGAASNSGDRGAASNSGDSGAASNSGDRGAASNSGYSGAASNSGDRGAASNSGYSGAASNSGYRGAASNSGYSGAAFSIGNFSTAETNAKESVAVSLGYQSKAKSSIGSWIVLAEKNDKLEIESIQSIKVDGEIIKADTWYILTKGKFIEA